MLIGEVARRTGVSARMLRHYDRIGLVVPTERTGGDYRQYTDADVEKLFYVEGLRSLGLSLSEVAATLEAPDFAAGQLIERITERVRRQRDAATELLSRLDQVRASEPQQWSDVLRVIELIRRFDAGSASDRQRLALSLVTGDERNSAVLVELALREDDPNVAGALVWSVARMNDAAVPALTEALSSTDRQRSRRALEALLKIGTPLAREVVAGQTQNTDGVVRVRANVVAGADGDERAIPALVEMVATGDLDVEAADAIEALAVDERVTLLLVDQVIAAIELAGSDGRRRLAGLLATIPGEKADSALSLLARDADSAVEVTARAHLLARAGRAT
ncbi:MerR family transcriptional regulator [Microbacterium oxydans]|uniref:MerR family transcriptional regulator n=1 Tax=Microbacterium oxydans TaxID=82380 RepID=UPI001141DAED|nr:MerR family transcriptional regulator [Microbacterium oxydans]KAB1889648.1 MerR family transcriptional regulator [Microbacterium oxydans]GED40021.1 transcriptional regulator [Microbacterium oxydans]